MAIFPSSIEQSSEFGLGEFIEPSVPSFIAVFEQSLEHGMGEFVETPTPNFIAVFEQSLDYGLGEFIEPSVPNFIAVFEQSLDYGMGEFVEFITPPTSSVGLCPDIIERENCFNKDNYIICQPSSSLYQYRTFEQCQPSQAPFIFGLRSARTLRGCLPHISTTSTSWIDGLQKLLGSSGICTLISGSS